MLSIFHRCIIAASIGNAIEFYDFSLYGALADVLGDLFFPPSNKVGSLLQSLSVFGAAFICRPIGGVIIGKIGDLYGRKVALEISILLMLIPSFIMGCLPTYDSINGGATFLVILIRMLQGIAAGGEFSSSLVFAVEETKHVNSCYWAAYVNSGANVGSLLGVGIVALIRNNQNKENLYQWGWRIPFLLTPILGGLGYWIRRGLRDTHSVQTSGPSNAVTDKLQTSISTMSIVWNVLENYWERILLLIFVLTAWGPLFYFIFVWIPVYLADILPQLDSGAPLAGIDPWTLNFFMLMLHTVLMPVCGWMVDSLGLHFRDSMLGCRIGLQISALAFCALAFPSFFLLSSGSSVMATVGYLMLVVPSALFGAAMAPFIVRQFPASIRLTGIGLAFNLVQAFFVSWSAVAATSLTLSWGPTAPAVYVVIMALISWLASSGGVKAVAFIRSRRKKSMNSGHPSPSATFMELASISSDDEPVEPGGVVSPEKYRGNYTLNPLNSTAEP